MNTPDAVSALSQLFADAEALADQAKAKLDQMPDLYKAINENGDAGALISTASSLRAKSIGLNLKAALLQFHSDVTEAAKLRGIDIITPFGGGPR